MLSDNTHIDNAINNPINNFFQNNSSPFNDLYNISTKQFKEMMVTYSKNKFMSTKEIIKIEKETRGQAFSNKWQSYRKNFLTASNFYAAAATKVEPSNKIKNMYYSNFTSKSTSHGIENEKNAKKMYIEYLLKKNILVKLNNTGLSISKTHPYLAASLDGLVTNTITNHVWGIEIKCPSSKYLQDMTEILADKSFFYTKIMMAV